MKSLEEENRILRAENASLKAENEALKETVRVLTEKVDFLLKRIEELEHKKTSKNSSFPPSSDIGSSPKKSLRKKGSRKSGGQPGHIGSTLSQSDNPDVVTKLRSNYCSHCGTSLATVSHRISSVRQVVDLPPPPPPIYHEYQQYSCVCPHCSKTQKAEFPAEVVAPIQYGATVHALISYLSVYQYIPYNRLQQIFLEVFHLPISEGTIENCLLRSSRRAMVVYDRIKENIQESSVIGSDETSARVNGVNWWIWVWQTVTDTFLIASKSRGYQTILEEWENGFIKAALVSDRWAAQLKTTVRLHQICLAHLLRDIIFVEEIEESEFIKELKTFILDIFTYKRECNKLSSTITKNFEEKLHTLLAIPVSEKITPHAHKLQKALIKLRASILPCIYEPEIPPDNNSSERAIRNVKVKQKISGQFKSGIQNFCILRSVIDTLRKRAHQPFDMLCQIMSIQSQLLKT